MQCANCQRPAIYIYAPHQISPTSYCDRHLPTFLKDQAKAGLLETTQAFHESRASAFAKLATHPAEPEPAEEAPEQPAEATADEGAPEDLDEEKPKRRRKPRKVAEEPDPVAEAEDTDEP